MKNFISELSGQKIYLLSPHLDDAILSCSELLSQLKNNTTITVINVFTAAHSGPYTLSAMRFLKLSGNYSNALDLYSARVSEDEHVLSQFNLKIINLGYQDALFRRSGNKNIYPTFHWHVLGKISAKDNDLLVELTERLEKLIPSDAIVVVPFNIAKHVDHALVRQAGDNLAKRTIYYLEFPYNSKNRNIKIPNELSAITIPITPNRKNNQISQYATQIPALFPNGLIPSEPETFLIPNPNSLSTRVYSYLSQSLKQQWQELWEKSTEANYFNSPNAFLSVLENFGYSQSLIVAAYKSNDLVGIVGIHKQKKFGLDFYLSFPEEFSCGNPFLADPKNPNILKTLASKLLELGNILLDNTTVDLINQLNTSGIRVDSISYNVNYYMKIVDTVPNRKIFLYKSRGVENKFNFHVYTGESPEILTTVFDIDSHSRKQGRGYALFSESQKRNFYLSLATRFKKHFYIHILTFENKPVAYIIGFLINGTYYASQIAFDETYSAYTPGKVLMVLLLDSLHKSGVNNLNFGPGDSHIKRLLTHNFNTIFKSILSTSFLVRKYVLTIYLFRRVTYHALFKNKKLYSIYRHIKLALKI